jgi:tetratricopeptide (TPR) repeat protein
MSIDTQARKKKRQRTVIGAGLLFAFFVGLLIAVLGVLSTRRSKPQLLVEGRKQLKAATKATDNRERMQLAHDSKDNLEQYVDGRGEEEDTGKLLLAAAIHIEGRSDASTGPDFVREVDTLLKEADLNACTTDDLLLAAELFAQSGRLSDANELAEVALKREDQRDATLRLSIRILHDLGRETDVLVLCEELTKLKPDDFLAWEFQVRIHENQGYSELVVDDCRKIIELFPDNSAPYRFRLLERLIEVGDRAGAKIEFEILEKQAPELLVQKPIVLAQMKHVEGEADGASAILEEILKNNPKHADALLLQGRIQLAKNQLDQAIVSLEALLELRPTDTQGHYLLGQAFSRKNDKEQAGTHFEIHKLVLSTRVKIHKLERQFGANRGNAELPEQIAQLYEQINAPKHAEYWRGVATQVPSASN